MADIQPILDKRLAGGRLTADECTTLLESNDVARMGVAADTIRQRRHPNDIVTYIIDRNINYTNVCNVVCTFCAFYRRPGAPDTYVRTLDEICEKIDETISLGGTGVLMQGVCIPISASSGTKIFCARSAQSIRAFNYIVFRRQRFITSI